MLKNWKKVLGIACVCGLCCYGGYWVWKTMRPAQTAQAQLPTVDVVEAKTKQIVPEASFVAKVESKDSVGLRARVTGFLQERLFQEGDFVKKGQELFVIERVNFEAAVREAKANRHSHHQNSSLLFSADGKRIVFHSKTS